jgi:hypothetical protein
MDCGWATVDARQMEVCLSILPLVVGLSLMLMRLGIYILLCCSI